MSIELVSSYYPQALVLKGGVMVVAVMGNAAAAWMCWGGVNEALGFLHRADHLEDSREWRIYTQ